MVIRGRAPGGTIDGVELLRIQTEVSCPRDASDRILAAHRERIEQRSVYDSTGEYALPRAQSSRAFSQALPNEHFCDPTLLGPEGRETYSAWLIERAAEWRDVYHNELLALNPIREMADWSGRCGCTRYIHLGAGSQILRIRWASNLGIRATTHDLVPGLIDRLGVRFQPASRMRTRLGYSHRCGHSTYNGQNGGL